MSPSGSRKDQVPCDAPMSAVEQILLQVFAHSCRQRVQLDGPAKGMGYYADAPTNKGESPLVGGNSGIGHLRDYLAGAKAASARAIQPASLIR